MDLVAYMQHSLPFNVIKSMSIVFSSIYHQALPQKLQTNSQKKLESKVAAESLRLPTGNHMTL